MCRGKVVVGEMKRIITVVMCTVLSLAICTKAFAYEFPHAFWEPNDRYTEALAAGDNEKVIEYGNKLLDIMSREPDNDVKTNIFVTRYSEIAAAYAALGDYENSAKIYQKLYEYTEPYGEEYFDYYMGSKYRVQQYTPRITMYTDKGMTVDYGAKHEKGNGVLFGVCANGKTRDMLPNESMTLIYQEFGYDLLPINAAAVDDAYWEHNAIEFALNCPNEGDDIKNARSMESSLEAISDLFAEYPEVPIFLRFAAEFDVWENPADPEEYKDAFRFVADYFRNRNSNVAIVWSPNQIARWDVDIDDYYPGDEYVDWVGISLYAQKYYFGDNAEEGALIFRRGINSDPVVAVEEIINKYGDRKPIMISECGCGHKIIATGEDTTDFALLRLKEYFSYLPMIYPQIKLIAYFDWYVDDLGEYNDFRLSTNPAMQKEYLRLVKGPRFVQDRYLGETDFCYRSIYNGMSIDSIFEVSCYAHSYGGELKSATYYIDEEYVGSSTEVPFTTYIDASDYAGGRHTLKAVVSFDNGSVLTTKSKVIISKTNRDISVTVSGEKVEFDQKPIIYNDRTMVPMRKIFEALGADVTWDDSTKTATGTKGDKVVKLSVGQRSMRINGKTIMLDTAPIILGGRTLVPARAIAEGLGCEVGWDEANNLVTITEK